MCLRNVIPHNVNALTVSMTVAMIKLMSSPVLQLNKEIALPDILGIPKYDNAAISSRKMDLSYSGETMSKMAGSSIPTLGRPSVTDDCHFRTLDTKSDFRFKTLHTFDLSALVTKRQNDNDH